MGVGTVITAELSTDECSLLPQTTLKAKVMFCGIVSKNGISLFNVKGMPTRIKRMNNCWNEYTGIRKI